jgi:hypothetical protein
MSNELLGIDDVLENVVRGESEIAAERRHILAPGASQGKASLKCVVSPSGAKQTSRERLCRPFGALQRCNALDSHGSRRGLICAAAPRLFYRALGTLHAIVSLALLLVLYCVPICSLAQEPAGSKQPVREIYVPIEEMNVLLEGDTQRVLLSRKEFDELKARARKSPVEVTPRDALILSADYEVTLDNARAEIKGTLEIEVLADGLHALPLDLAGVGVRRAVLDDRSAALGRAGGGSGGSLTLFVSGRGKHRLVLDMVTYLETNASQQILDFQLPRAAAARLRVTVPGNVEVKQGASVISRSVDDAAGVTRLELVPVEGNMKLVMSLNNRQLRQQRVVVVRSIQVAEVTAAYERLHASLRLSVLHRAVDSFRFALPQGFEITDVQSPLLARWSVKTEGEQRILEILLRQQTTETTSLHLSAVRTSTRMEGWTFPKLEPLDVAGQVSLLGLLVEDQLKAEAITPTGLIPVDNDAVVQRLPDSVIQAEPGAPRIRPIAAFYASDGNFNLTARFTRPPSRILAATYLLLVLRETGFEVQGSFRLTPEAEKLHEFDITTPADWHVASITSSAGVALPFERYATAGQPGRIHVRLPAGISPGQEETILFQATRTPPKWLDEWSTNQVVFPAFAVAGAAKDNGVWAMNPQDDMTVRPENLTGLTPLDEDEKLFLGLADTAAQLAYRYEGTGASATLTIERTPPRVTARNYSFLRVEPDLLTAHYELIYYVERARTRRLVLSLPDSTPASVTIRGLDGLQIKEYNSEVVEGRRRWTALLANWTASPADGQKTKVRLAVDFEQPMPKSEPKNYSLPLVQAEGVAYQSGVVAVEGSAEVDVQVVKHPRKVDVGELVDAEYETGRRLLGAFGYVGDGEPVTVSLVRHPSYPLVEAIVQQARYVTLVSAGGRSQTSARFTLRNKATYLEIRLPTGSTLWAAELDGMPAKPQREKDSLLLSFPAADDRAERNLHIVYETPVASVGSIGRMEIPALQLFLRSSGKSASREVPIADLEWQLHLPTGYRVLKSSGTVETTNGAPQQLAAWQTARFLYALGGGADPREFSARRGAVIASLSETTHNPYSQIGPHSLLEDMYGNVEGVPSGFGFDGAKKESTKTDESEAKGPAEINGVTVPKIATRNPGDSMTASAPPQPTAIAPPTAEAPRPDAKPGAKDHEELAKQPRPPVKEEKVNVSDNSLSMATHGRRDLAGVRSLKIDLQETGGQLTFKSLGVDPRLEVTLVEGQRLDLLAWALALGVALYGLAITNRPVRTKAQFIVVVCLAATLMPLITGWFELAQIVNGSFYAACLLIPYYLLVAGVKRLYSYYCQRKGQCPTAKTAATAIVLLCFAWTGELAYGQEKSASPKKPPYIVQVDEPAPPVKVPNDATILLYDRFPESGLPQVDRLLVPYARYVDLWNRAYPDQKLTVKPPPANYAPTGAAFTSTLTGEDHLLVNGQIEFDLFVDGYVEIPLPFSGGVLASALLDGGPARLKEIAPVLPPIAQPLMQGKMPAAQMAQPQQAAANPAAATPQADGAKSILMLYAQGKGRHKLELSVRFHLQREGGWRIAAGHLPTAPAAALTLQVPQAHTEVRLSGLPDRRSVETAKPNETIATALGPDGALRIQWRPRVNMDQIDHTLKARSDAVLSVQEDGLRLAWQVDLEFGRSQRETFTVTVPQDYLVEKVAGDNVRGWEVRAEGANQRLEVTLLRPATDHESFTIYLSKRSRFGGQATEFNVPIVAVQDAALHSGQLAIRRSKVLDLRTVETVGVSRVDFSPASEQRSASADETDRTPLGLLAYQSYRFATMPFTVRLAVTPLASQVAADVQTLLTIADRERILLSRFVLDVQSLPLHTVRIAIPDDLQLDRVTAPGVYDWAVTQEGPRRVLTVYFAAGQLGSTFVEIAGPLGKTGPVKEVPLPKLEVLDVQRQQGTMVVIVDPGVNVDVADLQGCQRALLDRTATWLTAEQRAQARLAVEYTVAGYSGLVKLTTRQALVNCFTVTNVRVTDRAIEETILLEFSIRDAGIRQISFLLPAALRDASISLLNVTLRQKTIEPVGEGPNGMVRVKLEFQEERINLLRVKIISDRVRTSDVQQVPLPVVETGRTEGRYVALQSSGRDEVKIESAEGLEPLGRQQQQWQVIADLLSRGTSDAYRVRPDAAQPQLSYRILDRAAVEIVGARVGLSEANLVVDANGAYRAVQIYRLNNATEQYLEIRLPAGATLWTAWVASEPVKPTQAPPGPAGEEQVRIPLVKTLAGDLDYEVTLTYGGALPPSGALRSVSFPLIRTVNINVEQSQVRLYLPPTHKWFRFGGTMLQVADEGDVQARNFNYFTKMTERLTQTMRGSDPFAKVRAENNLRVLKTDIEQLRQSASEYTYNNPTLQQEIVGNTVSVKAADDQARIVVEEPKAKGKEGDNRDALNDAFLSQSNVRAKNVVNELGQQFQTPTQPPVSQPAAQGQPTPQFDAGWLEAKKPSQPEGGKPQSRVSTMNRPEGFMRQNPQAPGVQFEANNDSLIPGKAPGQMGNNTQPGKERGGEQGEKKPEEADVVGRYQQRLNERSRQNEAGRNFDQSKGDKGAMGGMGGGLGIKNPNSVVVLDDSPPVVLGGALQPQGQPAGNAPTTPAPVVTGLPMNQGLVSLDVQIPRRGLVYRFTTPRGDAQISAQAASVPLVESLQRLAVVACTIALFAALYHLARSGSITRTFSTKTGSVALMLVGAILLFSCLFPVVGLILLVTGAALLGRILLRKPAAVV